MVKKEDLRLFFLVLLINTVMLLIEILVFGVKMNRVSLTLLIAFGVIETFLIDKFALKGGIIK